MPENPKDKLGIPNQGTVEHPKVPHAFECGTYLDLNEEVARLQDDASSKGEAGRKSKILLKYLEFRIVLIAMKAGSKWEGHKTNARIFIQPLRGHIRFRTPSGTFDICPGQLLTLDPGVVHSVDSQEESAFLLTLFSANEQ